LLDYTRQLIAFRRAHPVFRRRRFLKGTEASELGPRGVGHLAGDRVDVAGHGGDAEGDGPDQVGQRDPPGQDRGRQAAQPWQASYQDSALKTRKQDEPTASGRHTCWCAVIADRSAAMATPVLTLEYSVLASWTAVAHQSIRPGW
jgi:hypothetical protein